MGISPGFQSLIDQHAANRQAANTDRRVLSNEEREQALADHNNTIHQLQAKMTAAQGAGDHTALSGYQNQLNQVVADRTALFHPSQGPEALAHLGSMVWNHVHGNTPPPTQTTQTAPQPGAVLPNHAAPFGTVALPGDAGGEAPAAPGTRTAAQAAAEATPGTAATTAPGMTSAPVQLPGTQGQTIAHPPATAGEMKARVAQDLGYGAPAPPPNPAATYRRQLQEALPHLSDEDLDSATLIHEGAAAKPVAEKPEAWKPLGKPYQGEDGVWYQPQQSATGAIRHTAMEGYVPPPAKAGTSALAVQRGEYAKALGKKPEDLTFADEQNLIRLVKQAGTGSTVGTHIAFVPQTDGSIKAVQVQTTTAKSFGGVQPTQQPSQPTPPGSSSPSPAAPSSASATTPTPASLKNKVTAIARPTNQKSKAGVVQNGDTVGGRLTSAQGAADKAVNMATQVATLADDAASSPSAAKDKNLALSIIRGAAGRVNMQEYSLLTASFGGENKFKQWVANVQSGELTPEVRKQLVNLAHATVKAALAGQAQSRIAPGAPSAATPQDTSIDDIVNALNKGK